MSAKDRRARSAIALMSQSERAALRERARAALAPSKPVSHAVADTLRLASHTLFMPCSERSVTDGTRERGKRSERLA